MKDFIQCAAACGEFQRWLAWGKASQTICKGEKAIARLVKLEKTQTVNYLYQINFGQKDDISWKRGLIFCGMNDLKKNALYLTEDGFRCPTDGRSPLVTKTGLSVVEEITGKINRRAECFIANDRANLRVSEITSGQTLRDLQYDQKHGTKMATIGLFFNDQESETPFRSGYALEKLPKAAFMA